MSMIKLRVSGQVPLGGKKPGEMFMLETDADGLPMDRYWRRRMNEEKKYHVGALSIIHDAPPAPTPAPVAAASTPPTGTPVAAKGKATAPKKGLN